MIGDHDYQLKFVVDSPSDLDEIEVPAGTPDGIDQVYVHDVATGHTVVRSLDENGAPLTINTILGGTRGPGLSGLANHVTWGTYELLVTVINQTRATLRARLKQGMPPAERLDTEKLQKALGGFAQGLRKMLAAAKKGDKAAHDAAAAELEAAGNLLDETSEEIKQQG